MGYEQCPTCGAECDIVGGTTKHFEPVYTREKHLSVLGERDSYRFEAERKIGLRDELAELLGVMHLRDDHDEQFRQGVERLREIVDLNQRAARILDALINNEPEPDCGPHAWLTMYLRN